MIGFIGLCVQNVNFAKSPKKVELQNNKEEIIKDYQMPKCSPLNRISEFSILNRDIREKKSIILTIQTKKYEKNKQKMIKKYGSYAENL